MKKPIRTGGPAFPRTAFEMSREESSRYDHHAQDGMSLRDYFAGLAMAAILSNRNAKLDDAETARSAVIHADALIAELATGGAA